MKLIIFHFWILLLGGTFFLQSVQTGMASYYNDKFEGKLTASGEPYQAKKFTAAHLTLPFQTRVRVTNLKNNRSVVVTVNDRGPFVKGRIIDVSKAAAVKLGILNKGVAKVKMEVVSGKK